MGCGGSKEAASPGTPPAKVKENPPKPPEEKYVPFTEFPTPLLLERAQKEYGEKEPEVEKDDNGRVIPQPPRKRRSDVFSEDGYTDKDSHAEEAPSSLAIGPLKNLVQYLIGGARNDVDKVRAFFVWISSQDVLSFDLSKDFDKGSALHLLILQRAGHASYNDILEPMCKLANIETKRLKGYAKNARYEVGGQVPYGNTWLAVLVDGTWRVIDQLFGSCYVTQNEDPDWELVDTEGKTGKNTTKPRVHYDRDNFWFLTDPEQFIYSHYVEDSPWQLLARPVTADEFRDMAYLHQPFFEFQLRDLSHPKCVVETDTGEVTLTFTLPSESYSLFSFDLYKSRGYNPPTTWKGHALRDFVMVDTVDNLKRVKIAMKHIGKYKLVLSTCDVRETSSSYYYLCEYIIMCKKPKFNLQPNPPNNQDEFGAAAYAAVRGLKPISHKEGLITTQDGRVDITFACEDQLEFYHVLENPDMGKYGIQDYVRHYVDGNKVVFSARLPERGAYLLKLNSRQRGSMGKYDNVCNYLIKSEVGYKELTPFPSASSGQIGFISQDETLKLEPITHTNPFIQVQNNSALTIKMKCSIPLDLIWKLELQTATDPIDYTQYAWCEIVGQEAVFNIRCPRAGIYGLDIFAKKQNSSGVHQEVWKYVITVDQPQADSIPFPNRQSDWKETFVLIEPLTAVLIEKKKVDLKVQIDGAREVFAFTENRPAQTLECQEDGTFAGTIDTGQGKQELTLAAKFEENDLSYLLTYEIVDEAEMVLREKKQSAAQKEATERLQDLESREADEKELAKAKKKEEEDKANEEEIEYEQNKEELWEEERKLEEEHETVWQEKVKKEEEKNQKTEAKLSKKEEEEIVKTQVRNIQEEQDSAKQRQGELAKRQKENLAREQLRHATKRRDIANLETAIHRFESYGLKEERKDLTKAKRARNVLKAKFDLENAMENQNIDEIAEVVEQIKLRGHHRDLQSETADAERLINTLKRVHRLKVKILEMNRKTMSEIRGYQRPQEIVHRVMAGALLLMGIDEGFTQDWRGCQRYCKGEGRNGLNRRVHDLKLDDIHPEIAARAKEILENYEFIKVQQSSAGVAAFYVWAMGMIQESGKRDGENDDNGRTISPASLKRQRQIFKQSGINSNDTITPRHSSM